MSESPLSVSDGVVVADKPAGISSHDLVVRLRRALGQRRVGHAGTLDPFATGVMLLLAGRATRLQRYLVELPKTYEVLARLGATSTTGDTEGEIVVTGRLPDEPLVLPSGRIRQRPPAYSAVHVDGERAYRRARRGEHVEVPEREVDVQTFDLLWRRADHAAFRIVCSSGTYVRSLIADLGDAYCLELRRTAVGPFGLGNTWPGEGPPRPLPIDRALAAVMPVVDLDESAAHAAAHGRAVDGDADGPVLLRAADGAVAVARPDGSGRLKPVVGLRG